MFEMERKYLRGKETITETCAQKNFILLVTNFVCLILSPIFATRIKNKGLSDLKI